MSKFNDDFFEQMTILSNRLYNTIKILYHDINVSHDDLQKMIFIINHLLEVYNKLPVNKKSLDKLINEQLPF